MIRLLTFLQLRQILPHFLDHHTIVSLLITAVHPNYFTSFLSIAPKLSRDSQRDFAWQPTGIKQTLQTLVGSCGPLRPGFSRLITQATGLFLFAPLGHPDLLCPPVGPLLFCAPPVGPLFYAHFVFTASLLLMPCSLCNTAVTSHSNIGVIIH